jgi:crotonobetainyl-CoA:carnitine CoA-transferase CaiB-like acyl-CoA transferase
MSDLFTTTPSSGSFLDGVTVVDFSQVVSGPICGRLLADLGAEVVKVEPFEGDIIRHLEPKVGDFRTSVYFTWANAGKRSVAVDLRDGRGADLIRRLALASDVVLENFRPGVLAKFGLDASSLLAENPGLVYCSINGWGTDNSWSNRRAYAAMVQAEMGRVELDARLRGAPPEQSPHVDGDITPGLLAVSGIVAALFRRERTGSGEHLDVSMAEALLYTDEWTTTELAGYDGPRVPDTWRYPVFAVADGTGVAFMGDPHPRFVEIAAAHTDAPIAPTVTRDESLAVISDLVAKYPDFPTLEAQLDRFGFLVAEVRTVRDVARTPWAAERRVFDEVEPGASVPARPFNVRNATVGVQGRAPHLGEHTRVVLGARLGLDDGALDALEADGVIVPESQTPPPPDRLARPRSD